MKQAGIPIMPGSEELLPTAEEALNGRKKWAFLVIVRALCRRRRPGNARDSLRR